MNTVVFCKIKSKDFEEKIVFVTRVMLPASESQHVSDMFITKIELYCCFQAVYRKRSPSSKATADTRNAF